MNTQDAGPLHQSKGMEHGSTVECFLRTGLQQAVYHRLARDTHQHGQPRHLHPLQFVQHLVVLCQGLAKAKSRVEHNILLSPGAQTVYGLRTVEQHLTHRGFVRHIYIRNTQTAHHPLHLCGSRYIIDDVGTILLHRHAGNGGPESIYTDNSLRSLMPHNRQGLAQPLELVLLTDGIASRTRRTSPNINDAATLTENLFRPVRDCMC